MSYALDREITVLTNKTINVLLKENADALALYIFYIQVARKQKTNQVYATDTYCRNGLGFGKVRFEKAKKVLAKYNLIEKLQQRIKGRFLKHYIKVNYLWKEASLKEVSQKVDYHQVVLSPSGKTETNALSKYNKVLKVNKEKCLEKNTSQISYLSEIPREDVREFCTKFKVLPSELRDKAEALHDYCKANGKKYSDYKAFLRNAVRKDFGIRNDEPGTGDVIW